MILDNIEQDHNRIMEELYKIIYVLSDPYLSLVDKHITSSMLIKSIFSHVNHHFLEEENYMKQINFIEINKHKDQHREIRDEFIIFLKESKNISTEEYNEILLKYVRFFKEKILKHINEEDVKFLPQQ